jgi:prepilin-type N-terminal cleavage/methylation domain-containing protein
VNKKRETGFTIIEMLVAVAIAGILAAVAIPGFAGFGPRMRLKSASRDIVSDMQLAKAQALRDRSTYTIQFDTSTAQYTVSSGGIVHKTVRLSDYADVSLGSGYGARPDEPNPGSSDGVSFGDDKILFNSDGTSVSGTVYIKTGDNDTFAVGSLSAAGRIKTWHNYGSGWE